MLDNDDNKKRRPLKNIPPEGFPIKMLLFWAVGISALVALIWLNPTKAPQPATLNIKQVLELAEQDCGPAQQVVADSITEFARLADQVIHRIFPQPPAKLPCGVSGRILNSVPVVFALRSLAAKLCWPVELHFIVTPPSEGVRRLLNKL